MLNKSIGLLVNRGGCLVAQADHATEANMNSVELTPPEQALLRRAEISTHWWGSWKLCFAFFLFPVYLVVSRIYFMHRISEGYEYVLCLRLSDGLHPMPLSVLRLLNIAVICFGVFMLLPCYLVVQLWRERRIFYDLVGKLRGGSV